MEVIAGKQLGRQWADLLLTRAVVGRPSWARYVVASVRARAILTK